MERKVKISIRNLSKSFGPKQVLKGVNLDIYEGEIFYVIGKSGTGKSVLLKHISALMRPDSGTIYIDGEDIFALKEKELYRVRRKMGVLFQMAALFDSMSVYENVAFALRRFYNLSEEEIARQVKEKLAMVGLSQVEHLNPADLSGGMQKRVGLARAIAFGPEIVLYDEPTTGVDPILAAAVDDLILKLNRELKVTSVVISHDMKSVFRTAHRVALLYNGNFIKIGTPQELRESEDPLVRQFVEGRAEGPMSIL
ncbi:MAG: ABC transporter ATP-binding protein [Leptospiraceae bacterium]|nr:ABC transporter ATP-binding protein [Leptospiraceae bacterium]MDW8306589.1 ABC transporter ATP-binding protein [Leptospiraceae bacterium]